MTSRSARAGRPGRPQSEGSLRDDTSAGKALAQRGDWHFALDAIDLTASREAFIDTSEYDALPDGLAMAADGSIWVAMAGAGARPAVAVCSVGMG